MVSLLIGKWWRRLRPGTKWHLVESEIAGDVITNCGRRMTEYNDEVTAVSRLGTPEACKQCS